ncbi:MAG TPA: tRNA uridine-5-carboxymethylaminomethyl(34) synthesis GTPase MnmE, partial [Flavobacteriaceae bacterium]|nr:tRNA uridine-5-carboxymethylaminomethyl(34) synthesis GTPase MnmE [Flavobacteriaceae bacterium]
MNHQDTIVALATPAGSGAIAVIRISGNEARAIAASVFKAKNKKSLLNQPSHSILLGTVTDGKRIIDEVLASVFINPKSYTGEDTVEFSCHGSPYIQQEVIQLLLRKGCRHAKPGEFTLRAFLNGKMDLSQAEAVADIIASDNEAAHQVAIQQMRGGFSNELAKLREELLNFASLIELELDFAEEDVEFANREQFEALLHKIEKVLKKLIDSFATGNVIKNGIPVAIAGAPNAGKSTLLNALLNEERAIVSDIAGTTRDAIEDELSIGGIGFRFIDTAGIRDTIDTIESIGISKTYEKINQARLVLFLVDANDYKNNLEILEVEINKIKNKYPQKQVLLIANKTDLLSDENIQILTKKFPNAILISALKQDGIEQLKEKLLSLVNTGALSSGDTVVTNARHYDSLNKALEEIKKVQSGLKNNLSGDLLAIDIRQALYYFGEITGQV